MTSQNNLLENIKIKNIKIKNIKKKNIKKKNIRIKYAITFLLFLAIEVIIALFAHDTLIRPYLGDVLVVVVLYLGVRVIIPRGVKLLPLYLFLFAALVEFLQLSKLLEILHAENNAFLRVLIGSVFDIKDIICYGIGCILLGIYEWKMK